MLRIVPNLLFTSPSFIVVSCDQSFFGHCVITLFPKDAWLLMMNGLCLDDSGSMNHGTRKDDQDELVKRVARISTCLVPDGCGTGLQFINDKRPMNKDLSVQEVTEIMQSIEPHGNTKIGTHLEKKILKPLIYDVVKKGGRLERPILVSCITDGCAKGEAREKFQQTILKCVKFLREHGYPETGMSLAT